MSLPSTDHVTPYDRAAWSAAAVTRALESARHAEELRGYFGAAEYRVLRSLARRARAAPEPAALRVIIVPGIMGSQLGLRRAPPLPHDVLWLDPIDILHGRLASLALPGSAAIVPLGVVLYSYLRLQLQLRARGFAAEFHDYDWRLPVSELGLALARRLAQAAPAPVALVAHSMGGLVVRAALTAGQMRHVKRVVLLGTPNSGSFAAVQALRGTYAVVRKLARLVDGVSAEELTSGVFSSFPSLYDLLPHGVLAARADLFEPGSWPSGGLQPRAQLLAAARAARASLAAADGRFTTIAGVGQETVTALARRGRDFLYTLTRHGDGTVPTASALLPGAQALFAGVAHSELTRDARVAAAVADVLGSGRTRRLPQSWRSASRARVSVSDAALRRSHAGKVDWAHLSAAQRRDFLEQLNEPPHLRLRVPARRR